MAAHKSTATPAKDAGGQGGWNGRVEISATATDADVARIERKMREVFPGRAVTITRNPNGKGWT